MGSILVNGSPTSEFKFHKGLKQGDPLYPFLFILIMESLHITFKKVLNANLFKGISLNDSVTLSHFFFADDAVFVGEWDLSNIRTIINVLKCFNMASGLKINLHKSKLMGIGVDQDEINQAASLVGCSTLTTPFKYLGIQVGSNMSRIKSWDDSIAKISSRLSKWKLKLLCIGGRLTLTKSVLNSLPLYNMSIYKVPMGVLNNMEAIRRNFLNGVDNSDRKIAWIGWKKVLAAKKHGGLGISSFFALNRALLFKWIWRFISDTQSLWAQVIRAIYRKEGMLDRQSINSKSSPWTEIIREVHSLSNKDIDLISFAKRKVGNGENTSFWNQKWYADLPLKNLFPRIFALEIDKDISVAGKLHDPSLINSLRRNPRGGIEEDQMQLLRSCISMVTLSHSLDRWSWSLEGTGEFSVKSARNYIDEKLLPKAETATRWVKEVPIKVNIFAWRVSLDKLPTRLNLSLHGIDINSILCPICNVAGENASHLFFSCMLAKQVLLKITRWWELEEVNLQSYNDWFYGFPTSVFRRILKAFLKVSAISCGGQSGGFEISSFFEPSVCSCKWALDAWSIELVDDGWKNNNETWIWEILNRTNKLLQESEA
ncbi:RNA-directed DNA polymerase, eukaryota, reverse transcriptase zinc-binding domain protein [Tanacetum coccineum]